MSRLYHSRRALRPLSELRVMVDDVSNSLDSLCELLQKAQSEKIHAASVWALLAPMKEKLAAASGDLNDMRL